MTTNNIADTYFPPTCRAPGSLSVHELRLDRAYSHSAHVVGDLDDGSARANRVGPWSGPWSVF